MIVAQQSAESFLPDDRRQQLRGLGLGHAHAPRRRWRAGVSTTAGTSMMFALPLALALGAEERTTRDGQRLDRERVFELAHDATAGG